MSAKWLTKSPSLFLFSVSTKETKKTQRNDRKFVVVLNLKLLVFTINFCLFQEKSDSTEAASPEVLPPGWQRCDGEYPQFLLPALLYKNAIAIQ